MRLPSGSLEALKWIALVLMVGDHIDAVLFDRSVPWLFDLGRVAFPLFAFVLGYNLARPNPDWQVTYRRTLVRLLLFGCIAFPFSVLAFQRDDLLPLNILFTFACALALVWCIRRNDLRAAVIGSLVFLAGGVLVEFSWPGLLLVAAVWASFARPGIASQLSALACVAGLWFINANFHALLAIPLVIMAAYVRIEVPRWRWLFYVFYPAHLAVLAAVRYFS